MKGSMATDNFVVRLALPIIGMELMGRKAIICCWVRRVTRRRGWRTAVVGFITSAAAEGMHVTSSAIFVRLRARNAGRDMMLGCS